MIIIDYSQVMLSNLMMDMGRQPSSYNIEVSEDILRHMILNSIRMYNVKFGKDFGSLVIACDDKHYWRKQLFPHYKCRRKKARDDSFVNWNEVYTVLNRIRDEIKENFPYKTIQVEHAEADDIIATLTKTYYNREPILIVSGDKDFQQLQKYPGVQQYSPVEKKYIECLNPELFLKEHIIRGDVGDDIPNIASADTVFVENQRQSPLMAKKVEKWVLQSPDKFCNEAMMRNYNRNQSLIDLEMIPENIEKQILEQFENFKPKSNLYNYFLLHKLKTLMGKINEFQ